MRAYYAHAIPVSGREESVLHITYPVIGNASGDVWQVAGIGAYVPLHAHADTALRHFQLQVHADPTSGERRWGVSSNRWQMMAIEAARAYVHWYRAFVDVYERDLAAKGLAKPKRIRYAREQGIKKLAELVSMMHASNRSQTDAICDLFEGFRELAECTDDLPGRGALIVRLVEDVTERLRDLRLIGEQIGGEGRIAVHNASLARTAVAA